MMSILEEVQNNICSNISDEFDECFSDFQMF